MPDILLERFTFEKGKTRGGGTAHPGQNLAEKQRFFSRIGRPYGLKCRAFQTENALGKLQAGAIRAEVAEDASLS